MMAGEAEEDYDYEMAIQADLLAASRMSRHHQQEKRRKERVVRGVQDAREHLPQHVAPTKRWYVGREDAVSESVVWSVERGVPDEWNSA
jgi:hypothetical protein